MWGILNRCQQILDNFLLPGKEAHGQFKEVEMKLYVGNLDHSVMDTELKALFSMFGAVARARVVTDYYTRQSKGFGYVVMAENEDGVHAIARMNGKRLHDRPLVVNMARPRDKRLGRGW